MALAAGVMSVTIEFAKDLKDRDWFCRMDPYSIVRVGGQTFRSATAVSGGRNPVWNQTFKFNIINENDVEIEIKDDDIGRDEYIGSATFTLAKAREFGTDRINVPVSSKRSQKQHGFISVALKWVPNEPAVAEVVAVPTAPALVATAPLQPQMLAAPPVYAPPPTAPVYAQPAPTAAYPTAPQQPPTMYPPPSQYPQAAYGAPPMLQPGYPAPSAPQYAQAPSPMVYAAPQPPQPTVVYTQPSPVYMAAPQPAPVVYYTPEIPYYHHHHHHHRHHHHDTDVIIVENGPFW